MRCHQGGGFSPSRASRRPQSLSRHSTNAVPKTTATGSSMTVTATVENWADICIAVYDTRAQKVHFDNTVLGVPKDFYIYTPADYSQI